MSHLVAKPQEIELISISKYIEVGFVGNLKMHFWKFQGQIPPPPMSKIRDSRLEGFAISRPSVASIYNYIYRCVFEF